MLKFLTVLIVSVLSFSAYCADRIVILAPAAGDIIEKLGAENKVVGVTKNLKGFEKATPVGSHLKPNIEIIKSLNPDLLIITGGKYFTDEMSAAIGARAVEYDPRTLSEVTEGIRTLGKETGKADTADKLIKSLTGQMKALKKPSCSPNVFFEVTQMPLMAAGTDSIIGDMIKAAGGQLIPASAKKLFKTNAETVLASRPDIYIWQTGAMNKNPDNPASRPEYKSISPKYIHVNEYDFSRANTTSFKSVLFLNRAFSDYCKQK